MSEVIESLYGKKVSRRRVLKGTAKALQVVSGLVLGQVVGQENPPLPPEDTLNPEELRKNHIRIHNTPRTELLVRRSALNIDLFRDAAEGRTGDAVVVLAESETLSWNASERLPKEFRDVFQAIVEDPAEQPNSYWEVKLQRGRDLQFFYEIFVRNDKSKIEKLRNGEYEPELRKRITDAEEAAGKAETQEERMSWISLKSRLDSELDSVIKGEELPKTQKNLAMNEKTLEGIERENEMLEQPQSRVEYAREHSDAVGKFIRPGQPFKVNPTEEQLARNPADFKRNERYKRLVQDHPEWINNNYVFVAVGGELTPKPTQRLNPNDYEEIDAVQQISVEERQNRYRFSEPNSAGKNLRHEIGHYHDPYSINDEYVADTNAYEAVLKAWQNYVYNRDSSGYSFVFRNKYGSTFAKVGSSNIKA